jgi:hypothetical protein
MKKEQIISRGKLQFSRKAVAQLGRVENGAAYITGYSVFCTLVTLTQRCCGGEDSSAPWPTRTSIAAE